MSPAVKPELSARRETRAPDNRVRFLRMLLVFLPILATFAYVRSLAVEVPMWDDWDLFIPHFQHLAAGQLQWSDINTQNNESLAAFPMMASLALAKLSGGRLLPIVYLSCCFLGGSLVFLFLFFRMLRLPGRWSDLWFLPAGLLLMGWRQGDSLLWSTDLLNTMALFFILASLYFCLQACRIPIFFSAAVLCAWIASFTMASGLLVWFCGAVALTATVCRQTQPEREIGKIIAWLVLGAACVLCFLGDVAPHAVPWPTGISYVAGHWRDAIRYSLVYLGGSLSANPYEALRIGFAFVLLAIPVLLTAVRHLRKRSSIWPGLLLSGFVAMALVPLLNGRLGLGVDQAFASRYVTLSALAPIGVYFCSLALADSVRIGRYLAVAMVLLLAGGIYNSYSSGLESGRLESLKRTDCAAALRNFRQVDRARLACGYPDPGVVLERAPGMERYHLSLFGQ